MEGVADPWYWLVGGNPNRPGTGAKGKAVEGKIRNFAGIPKEEYCKIEMCKDDLVEDERVNRSTTTMKSGVPVFKYGKPVLKGRSKVESKGKLKRSRSVKSSESRPTKAEVAHVKASLKALMSKMEEMLGAVRRLGGVPILAPKHFSKKLDF